MAVYVLMLVVIRALGRRTVGNISAFDLLVALMLGEIVDEMMAAYPASSSRSSSATSSTTSSGLKYRRRSLSSRSEA